MPEQMTLETLRFAVPGSAPAVVPAWINAKLEISVHGPDGTWRSRTAGPYALIGSSPGCDIVLPQGSTPDKAVYLHATRHGIFFVDLSPDVSVTEIRRGWLDHRDLELGPYRVSASLTSSSCRDPSGRCDLLAPATLRGDRPVIEICDDDRSARVQLSRGLAIVGRSNPSTLRIKNRIVSAIHAALYVDQDRLWVLDLDSTNGLRSRGVRIRIALLSPGDRISLGGPTLALERFDPNPRASAAPQYRPLLAEVEAFPDIDPPSPGSFSLRDTDPVPDQSQPPADEWIDPSLGRLMLRENTRQKRRRLAFGAVAIAAVIAFASTGLWAWNTYTIYTSQDPATDHPMGSAFEPHPYPGRF